LFIFKANLGKISDKSTILSAVLGNLALTQAQAIIVGFFASVGAIILKAFEKDFDVRNSLVLVAGSISTASFASLILGIIYKIKTPSSLILNL
jgi:solute carrier family 41